jgi:hypothetical protein
LHKYKERYLVAKFTLPGGKSKFSSYGSDFDL